MHDDSVWSEIGELVRQSRHEQAIERHAASPRTPRPTPQADVVACKEMADQLYQRADYAEALSCYEWVLRRRPNFTLALYNAALCHKRLGRMDQAIALLQRAAPLAAKSVSVQAMLGEVLFAAGRFDEALTHLDLALALAPDDAMLAFRRRKAAMACDGGLDDLAAVFGDIYASKVWGGAAARQHRFFSGEGSHQPRAVQPYVEAVTAFLAEFPSKPDVVDIGCGDFNIGSKIRPACGRYQAMDVVADLIAYNTQCFAGLDVQFAQLDITRQAPPKAQVVFIREVFQHLSNDQIAAALANLTGRYEHLVFTEALPTGPFTPNLDKPSGENVRMQLNGSGVVLTEAPFNLAAASERMLCRIDRGELQLITRVYAAP